MNRREEQKWAEMIEHYTSKEYSDARIAFIAIVCGACVAAFVSTLL